MDTKNDYMTQNKQNEMLYEELVLHISSLKMLGIVSNDAAASKMKILEDIFITIKNDAKIVLESDVYLQPFITTQDDIKKRLKNLINEIGCTHIETLISLYTDVADFREKFGWLSKYYKFYKVSVKDLVFCSTDIEFVNNVDKLITSSFIYKYNVCNLNISYNGFNFILQGLMNIDQNPIYNEPYFEEKRKRMFGDEIHADVPIDFKQEYLSNVSNVTFVLNSEEQIYQNMEKDYMQWKTFCDSTIEDIIEKFSVLTHSKQRQMIVLCLLNESTYFIANSLYENYLAFSQQDLRQTLFWNLRQKLKDIPTLKQAERERIMGTVNSLSYEEQIILLKTSQHNKSKALSKIKELGGNKESNAKAEHYLQNFCKIPFGIYRKEQIFIETEKFNDDYKLLKKKIKTLYNIDLKPHYDKKEMATLINSRPEDSKKYLLEIEQKFNVIQEKKQKYLSIVRQKLDDVVYGQELIKEQINMLVGQWLSGSNEHGCAIGICGPPGTGKTDIIKNGISKCLVDKNGNTRPFIFISLGGSKDSAEFKGHGYTYQHSQWGKLVQAIMDAKCMNPIIFFDEIDKVSESTGRDIINFLVHVTDQTQNEEMSDRYFDGVKFDYSGFLIFCTYNDPTVLGKVLRDRFTELHVEALTIEQKVAIIQNFTIKKLCDKIGINEVKMSDEIVRYIISNYTREAGIRKLIEKISEILKYINVQDINNKEYILNEELVDKILDRFNKPIQTRIIPKPAIGVVNGLYATNVGDGGITTIQVERTIGKEMLGLKLSGKLGETMKESAECAKTLAWKMLTEDEKKVVIEEYTDKPDATLHIHCPDAAMPKDGPSAGITLTTVIYSFLTKKPVNNEVAMTGEVDLLGNVKAIGGLKEKINGAILAGCTKVIIPKENEQDYDRLTKLLGDKINIVMAETIDQVIEHCF